MFKVAALPLISSRRSSPFWLFFFSFLALTASWGALLFSFLCFYPCTRLKSCCCTCSVTPLCWGTGFFCVGACWELCSLTSQVLGRKDWAIGPVSSHSSPRVRDVKRSRHSIWHDHISVTPILSPGQLLFPWTPRFQLALKGKSWVHPLKRSKRYWGLAHALCLPAWGR